MKKVHTFITQFFIAILFFSIALPVLNQIHFNQLTFYNEPIKVQAEDTKEVIAETYKGSSVPAWDEY